MGMCLDSDGTLTKSRAAFLFILTPEFDLILDTLGSLVFIWIVPVVMPIS